jgi:uncharacterized protein (TIGR03067 family)
MRQIVWLLTSVLVPAGSIGFDSPQEYGDEIVAVDIQGTWQLTKAEFNGRRRETLSRVSDSYWCGRFTFSYRDGDKIEGSYIVDRTCKPAHLSIVPSNGLRKGQTLERVYQIDGDRLMIADRIGDGHLQSVKDSYSVYTYKRVR